MNKTVVQSGQEHDAGTRFRDGEIHAPTGSTLQCKGWVQEAALRMLMNNLDPAVAEHPRAVDRLWRHRPRGAQLGML